MKRKRLGRENSKLPLDSFCLPLGENTVCVNVDLPDFTVLTKSRSSSVAVANAEAQDNVNAASSAVRIERETVIGCFRPRRRAAGSFVAFGDQDLAVAGARHAG